MVSNAQIRKQARQMLGGGIFQQQWLFALIVSLIAGAILGVSSIVVFFVCGIIMLCEAKYYLQCSRQEIAVDKIEVLFDGIKGEIGQNILLGVLVSVYVFLWSLLLVIPGIIKSYAYSMAFYLKVDHPEYTAKQAIKESEQLMYGHKMQLFLLDLSFIGWIIVGAFCFGVGTLWVTAYQKSARVQFYRNLIGESNVAN